MNLHLGTLTEERLQALCTWQYEPPYHIYQWGPYAYERPTPTGIGAFYRMVYQQ